MGLEHLCTVFGLPQGSALSPLLFILYVLDMTKDLPSQITEWMSCYKFADDGTLLITHSNMTECHRLMQLVCDHLTSWCIKNKMVINCDVNKTEAIILKTANTSDEETNQPPQLRINGESIRYIDTEHGMDLMHCYAHFPQLICLVSVSHLHTDLEQELLK